MNHKRKGVEWILHKLLQERKHPAVLKLPTIPNSCDEYLRNGYRKAIETETYIGLMKGRDYIYINKKTGVVTRT